MYHMSRRIDEMYARSGLTQQDKSRPSTAARAPSALGRWVGGGEGHGTNLHVQAHEYLGESQ